MNIQEKNHREEMKKKRTALKGFSLIEMIIAMVVSIIIITFTISVFASTVRSWNRFRRIQRDMASAMVAYEMIGKTIRMSSLVKMSVTYPNTLIFMYNNSQNRCIAYFFNSGKLQVSEFTPATTDECRTGANYTTWKDIASPASGAFRVTESSLSEPYAVGKATVTMNIDDVQYQTTVSFMDYQGVIQ